MTHVLEQGNFEVRKQMMLWKCVQKEQQLNLESLISRLAKGRDQSVKEELIPSLI